MINIVGAGLAGLLAANMVRNRGPVVYEAQSELPNNHSAVLRFRTSTVGDVLGIPFKPVTMIKDTLPWLNPVADALTYSFKCSGVMRSDRSINGGQTVGQRWIAPPDLIAQMAEGAEIHYNAPFNFRNRTTDAPVISTIPMPMLMKELDYPRRHDFKFGSVAGWNIRATVAECDAYVSVYVPDPEQAAARISITGNELIIEIPDPRNELVSEDGEFDGSVPFEVHEAARLLGVSEEALTNIRATRQKYAKITPIDETGRREFLHWATDKHGIFSLGRFATWRPGLLLDDLVQDVRLIERWTKDQYAVRKHR